MHRRAQSKRRTRRRARRRHARVQDRLFKNRFITALALSNERIDNAAQARIRDTTTSRRRARKMHNAHNSSLARILRTKQLIRRRRRSQVARRTHIIKGRSMRTRSSTRVAAKRNKVSKHRRKIAIHNDNARTAQSMHASLGIGFNKRVKHSILKARDFVVHEQNLSKAKRRFAEFTQASAKSKKQLRNRARAAAWRAKRRFERNEIKRRIWLKLRRKRRKEWLQRKRTRIQEARAGRGKNYYY
jgi:hypothetical protein